MITFDLRDEKTPEEVLSALVFQAMGAVSMCWSHIERAGVFQSSEAVEVGKALIDEMKSRGLIKS